MYDTVLHIGSKTEKYISYTCLQKHTKKIYQTSKSIFSSLRSSILDFLVFNDSLNLLYSGNYNIAFYICFIAEGDIKIILKNLAPFLLKS